MLGQHGVAVTGENMMSVYKTLKASFDTDNIPVQFRIFLN